MKKVFLLLIIVTIISSCNKKIYYEYLDAETKNYYTLKIDKKKNLALFNGTAEGSDLNRIKYYSITGDSYIIKNGKKNNLNNDYTYGVKNIYKTSVIDWLYESHDCIDLFSENNDYSLKYLSKNGKDSISLLKINARLLIEKDSCTQLFNIKYFPPYLKKTNKIDYTKFPEDIREAIIALDKGKSYEEVEEILQKQKDANGYKN